MNRSQDYRSQFVRSQFVRSQFVAQQNRRLKVCVLVALGLHVGAIAIALVQVPFWQWLNLRSRTAEPPIPVEFVNIDAAKLAQPPIATQRTAPIDAVAGGDRNPELPIQAGSPAANHPKTSDSGTARPATPVQPIAFPASQRSPSTAISPTELPTELPTGLPTELPIVSSIAASSRSPSEQTRSRAANSNRRSIATGSIDTKRDKIWSAYDTSVQRQIAQQWSPVAENLSVDRTRRSIVRFTIDRQGQLQALAITQSSGLESADRMALAAVRAAAPFPRFPRNAKEQTLSVTQTFIYNSEL